MVVEDGTVASVRAHPSKKAPVQSIRLQGRLLDTCEAAVIELWQLRERTEQDVVTGSTTIVPSCLR